VLDTAVARFFPVLTTLAADEATALSVEAVTLALAASRLDARPLSALDRPPACCYRWCSPW
jgi:hypothetical protein